MNAYPAELVVQLHPFLLVSGLVGERAGDASKVARLPHPVTTHPEVCKALVSALGRRSKHRVWQPPSSAPRMHTALVDYAYVYPPAKVRAGGQAASEVARRALGSLPPRSPLSPLQVGGPLFPDGILAPAWIRKHTEYLPAVHLVFLCLPIAQGATLADDVAVIDAMTEARQLGAVRGIRVAVVLLCPASALARSDMDARLAHIRRAAGLEGRGSLFVLSAETADVEPFVQNVERALHDTAVEYYKERARHVRRNRARYPPPPSIAQPILAAAGAAGALKPGPAAFLAPEGWAVRTAAKLGTFAEMQGELADALSHYTEAYEHLMQACLANTKILAPRTKRWAEAKVLADTLSFKMVKLHLYKQGIAQGVHQFTRHVQRVAELSAGWGIGTSTYEFWSWLAKQFQLLGDLVQQATHPPDGTRALQLGGAPADALLAGTGTHMYHAALCTMERAARFRAVSDEKAELPTYANEAQVDHTALVVEMLGSAYEAFRHAQLVRHAHLAAARIALVYAAAGLHQDALPYLERALRWYRRDRWAVPRFLLVGHAAQTALALDEKRAALPYLLEMAQPVPSEARAVQEKSIAALLPLLAGADRDAAALALEPGAAGLLDVQAVFARQTSRTDTAVPFQLVITPTTDLASFSFALLRVYVFGRATPLFSVRLGGDAHTADLGTIPGDATTKSACTLDVRRRAVLTGALQCSEAGPLVLSNTIFTLDTTVGQADLPIDIARGAPQWVLPTGTIPLPPCAEPRGVHIEAPPPTLEMHVPPALLAGEVAPLAIEIGAPLVRGVIVLPPETVEAGAAFLNDAGERFDTTEQPTPHQHRLGAQTSKVWIRAPQSAGTLRLRLYGVASPELDALPTTHIDRLIAVTPAFGVRVHSQWTPGAAPRAGRLTTEVCYLGPTSLVLHGATVDADGSIEAGAPLGAASDAPWETNDTAVWVTPLKERVGPVEGTASLVLRWRRSPDAPLGTTRLLLASLTPPAVPPVQLQIRAPGRATLQEVATVEIVVANCSSHARDILVEVEQGDAFLLAGARRKHLSMLMPNETRTTRIQLMARHAGLHPLPKVRAYELRPQSEPIALGVPLPGVLEVA